MLYGVTHTPVTSATWEEEAGIGRVESASTVSKTANAIQLHKDAYCQGQFSLEFWRVTQVSVLLHVLQMMLCHQEDVYFPLPQQ